jgi:CO dehydrogenase/acetyl-CoA synthase delta subunit
LNWLETPAGKVPQLSTTLSCQDRVDGCKVRWSIGRNSYIVPPGLYAIGSPDETSPVVVTANYKMSYDLVRNSLKGRNVWLLILETFGINVWCAAGKGTFGTHELIHRINGSGLNKLLNHRTLLLPILGAPGVAAHEVKRETGFNIRYAAIRAAELPEFLDNGMVSTPKMKELSFTVWERLVLTPVELVQSSKYALPIAALFMLCGWFLNAVTSAVVASVTLLISVLIGTVVVPVFLPWLPSVSFALKGAFVGLLWNSGYLFWLGDDLNLPAKFSTLLFCTAVSSLLALNFTGCTPFTSLSGVRKEMRYAIPGLFATFIFSVFLGGWAILS